LSLLEERGNEMKTVAIPVFGNRIAPRFDCSVRTMLVNIKNNKVIKRASLFLYPTDLGLKTKALISTGADVIICGGLTETCEKMLEKSGIKVISRVRGEVDEIISKFLTGKLA